MQIIHQLIKGVGTVTDFHLQGKGRNQSTPNTEGVFSHTKKVYTTNYKLGENTYKQCYKELIYKMYKEPYKIRKSFVKNGRRYKIANR